MHSQNIPFKISEDNSVEHSTLAIVFQQCDMVEQTSETDFKTAKGNTYSWRQLTKCTTVQPWRPTFTFIVFLRIRGFGRLNASSASNKWTTPPQKKQIFKNTSGFASRWFSRRKAWRTLYTTPSSCIPASCRNFPRWSLDWRVSWSKWGLDWPRSVSATARCSTQRYD